MKPGYKFVVARKGGPADQQEKYVVSRGADGALALMPYEVWIANFNRLRQGVPGPELREYLRRISQASHVVDPDSQGRIAVPGDFLRDGGVGKKVTVVGMGNYMELWDPDLLAAKMAEPPISDKGLTDEFFR